MKSILSSTLLFLGGAVIGSAVTYKILKTKYERLVKEEVDSVKEVFARLSGVDISDEESSDDVDVDVEEEKLPTEKDAANDIISAYGYVSDNTEKPQKGGPGPMESDRPYVITPEEFGELEDEGYETIVLSYYTDGILADDSHFIVEDVDSVVGNDFADHFGEYEDDSVHVRNDRLKTDYEILLEARAYKDVNSSISAQYDE